MDKIVPTTALFFSMICIFFVANHLLRAESYSKEGGHKDLETRKADNFELKQGLNKDSITLSAFIDLDKVSENLQVSEEKINEVYNNIINRPKITTKSVIKKYQNSRYAQQNGQFTKDSKNQNFKILIIPGHDKEYPGAIFNGLTEEAINIELAEILEKLLNHERGIEALMVRDRKDYINGLEEYFNKQEDDIREFIFNHKIATQNLIKNNLYRSNQTIAHNHVEFEVVKRLYGINKWSNKNDFDMAIHIHFNDYPRRDHSLRGKYNGFAIYIPEKQFHYAEPSRDLAENIADTLKDYFLKSNMPIESDNLIETQDLIALGSNHTLDHPSILVEYDYLYEDQYQNYNIRRQILNEKAYRTYLGIMNFLQQDFEIDLSNNPDAYLNFGLRSKSDGTVNQTNLIHKLEYDLWLGQQDSRDVVSLQAFLRREGYFGNEKNNTAECSISGNFDLCTQRAAKDFQAKQGLIPSGFVGEITRGLINGII